MRDPQLFQCQYLKENKDITCLYVRTFSSASFASNPLNCGPFERSLHCTAMPITKKTENKPTAMDTSQYRQDFRKSNIISQRRTRMMLK